MLYNIFSSVERYVKIEKSGRILISAVVRRELHLKEGESQVLLTVEGAEVKLTTRREALKQVRAELRRFVSEGTDLAGELLAERRREAAREDGK